MAVASLLVVVFISFLSLRKMNRFDRLIPNLDDIVRVNEDGSIDMDNRLQAVISTIGQTMFQSLKMSMLQGLSVNSKLEKGLKGAMAKDIIEEKMPLLDAGAGILKEFTGFNVKQYIAKNPDALMQLLGMPQVQGLIGQFMGNNGAQGPSQSRSRM